MLLVFRRRVDKVSQFTVPHACVHVELLSGAGGVVHTKLLVHVVVCVEERHERAADEVVARRHLDAGVYVECRREIQRRSAIETPGGLNNGFSIYLCLRRIEYRSWITNAAQTIARGAR